MGLIVISQGVAPKSSYESYLCCPIVSVCAKHVTGMEILSRFRNTEPPSSLLFIHLEHVYIRLLLDTII